MPFDMEPRDEEPKGESVPCNKCGAVCTPLMHSPLCVFTRAMEDLEVFQELTGVGWLPGNALSHFECPTCGNYAVRPVGATVFELDGRTVEQLFERCAELQGPLTAAFALTTAAHRQLQCTHSDEGPSE